MIWQWSGTILPAHHIGSLGSCPRIGDSEKLARQILKAELCQQQSG